MRAVTPAEFYSLVAEPEDIPGIIRHYYDTSILADLQEIKEEMIEDDQTVDFDLIFTTEGILKNTLHCTMNVGFVWTPIEGTEEHRLLFKLNGFTIYDDQDEQMKAYGDRKMDELDLPPINNN